MKFAQRANPGPTEVMHNVFLVAIVAFVLSACASVAVEDGRQSPESSTAAMPERQEVPGPRPARPATPPGKGVEPVRIRARERIPNAVYRRQGPILDLSIPASENVQPGFSSTRGRGVAAPALVQKSKEDSTLEAWNDTSGTFLSTDFDDNPVHNSGFLFIPPDSHDAAGPLHLINVVNTIVSVHLKDGSLDFRTSLADFFGPLNPETFTFDPKVVFDQYSDRWLVVTLEQTSSPQTSRIFLGVSDDANPNGTWYLTEFNSRLNVDGNWSWADYPGFAVGREAVYITANMFSFSGPGYGVRLWIVDKGEGSGGLYDGGTTTFSVHDPYELAGIATTTQPAHLYGAPPGTTDTFLVSYSGLHDQPGTEYVQVIRLEDPLGTPTFTQQYVQVGNIENTNTQLPDADQLGSSTDIETNDRRALDAVWLNDRLFMTATVRSNSNDNNGQATAYWWEVDSSTSPLSLANHGEIGGEDIAAGAATFFPSVAVNGYGDVTLGFSASASSIYAGAYFVTREAGDGAGATGTAQTVKAGEDYYVRTFSGTRNRWGDYSGTVVDPVDGCFWVYNQYAKTRGTPTSGQDGRWATAYARTCNLTHACSESLVIPADQWTRFGVPCNTAPDNRVEDVFAALDPDDYGTTWAVFERDASDPPAYVRLALTDALVPGVGYWVYTATGVSVNLSGTIHPLADIGLFGSDPDGRQNYLGHNQELPVSWADVLFVDGGDVLSLDEAETAGLVSRQMFKWNGAAYQVFNGLEPQVGTLEPFDGFWSKAFASGVKLRIPQADSVSVDPLTLGAGEGAALMASARIQASEPAAEPAKLKPPRLRSWHVRLVATAGGLQDPGNLFGRVEGASVGVDVNDLEEPQPFGHRYLTILFTHPLLRDAGWGYTSDFRPLRGNAGGAWPFVVRASPDVSVVTLSWQGDEALFDNAWLTDEESGETMRINAPDQYTFRMVGEEHHFIIEIDPEGPPTGPVNPTQGSRADGADTPIPDPAVRSR